MNPGVNLFYETSYNVVLTGLELVASLLSQSLGFWDYSPVIPGINEPRGSRPAWVM